MKLTFIMEKNCKRILHLRSSGGLLGAESVILEIASHSEQFGYKSVIGVIADSRDGDSEFLAVARKRGFETHSFVCNSKLDLNALKHIHNFVRTGRISGLHCHGYKEDMYGVLARPGVPLIATNHLWKTNSLLLHLYRLLDGFLLRYFSVVTGVSGVIVAEMQKIGIKNSIKIVNGVDIKKYNVAIKNIELSNSLGLDPSQIVFGMVSSLTSEKNHSCALTAFASIDNKKSQLLIIGDGPLLEKLKCQAAAMNILERVCFAGRHRNINEILSVIDVFLLPSLMEGLPMALLEAMACGKAVIASRVGENANVVDHNISGIIVEPGDVDDLAQAMQVLLRRNDLIKEFGQQARITVENQFSAKLMTRNYCQMYDQLLAGDGP